MPCRRVKVLRMRRSAEEVWEKPKRRSSVVMRREATVLEVLDAVGWRREMLYTVPFKPILQSEELSKGWVVW
jgi:hypothetical protein